MSGREKKGRGTGRIEGNDGAVGEAGTFAEGCWGFTNRIRIRKFQEAGDALMRGTYRLPR